MNTHAWFSLIIVFLTLNKHENYTNFGFHTNSKISTEIFVRNQISRCQRTINILSENHSLFYNTPAALSGKNSYNIDIYIPAKFTGFLQWLLNTI